MPPVVSLILDKYRQAKTGKIARQKGAGLGLAILKLIVEVHAGKSWTDSELGKRSVFSFTGPAARL